jgi:hypothetical protein
MAVQSLMFTATDILLIRQGAGGSGRIPAGTSTRNADGNRRRPRRRGLVKLGRPLFCFSIRAPAAKDSPPHGSHAHSEDRTFGSTAVRASSAAMSDKTVSR